MKHPTVLGVGINDADYPVVKEACPYYAIWQAMLTRCYSPRMLAKNPTYVGCSVAPEWYLFSTFKAWMQQQNWQGKQLDKDIRVPGNKEYGPFTCLFVTQAINGLLNTQAKRRGELPLGVARHGDRFKATLKKGRRSVHIGVFDSIVAAAAAYQQTKADWIDHHATMETCPTTKTALMNAANRYRRNAP